MDDQIYIPIKNEEPKYGFNDEIYIPIKYEYDETEFEPFSTSDNNIDDELIKYE